MRIAKVIGTVTLSRAHPALVGARWLLGVPFSLAALRAGVPDGESIVMFDELGAGSGACVGFSEGAEAAAPFHPQRKPVDAYCACILDSIGLSE
jgi:microcompartment protein CcmK/EutM